MGKIRDIIATVLTSITLVAGFVLLMLGLEKVRDSQDPTLTSLCILVALYLLALGLLHATRR